MNEGPSKDGEKIHDHALKEHQEIRELLYEVDNTKVDDPSHPEKLEKAMKAVTHHVEEEESELLPLIEKLYSVEELKKVGASFKVHKYTAPTRPHPSTPMQGPLAAAAGMMAKPIDLARDAVRNVVEKAKE